MLFILILSTGVVYLSIPLLDEEARAQTPERLLRPYLDATLTITLPAAPDHTPQPLFTLYYVQHPATVPASSNSESAPILPDPFIPLHVPEMADSTIGVAEATFWKAVEQLKAAGRRPQLKEGPSGDGTSDTIDSFWPPLDIVEEEDEW